MANLDSLVKRIDSLLGAERQRIQQFQRQQAQEYHRRQERLEHYEQVMRRLAPILTPRLRALAERFNDAVKIEPARRGHTREMLLHFRSELAKISLKFSSFPDHDVRNIIFEYDLEIVPVLMTFNAHLELQQPLVELDVTAVVEWFDDRIVEFVSTYLATFGNSYYLRGQQVEDPIAGISFPKPFAAGSLQRQGQAIFFVSQDTRDEFVRRYPETAAESDCRLPHELLAQSKNGKLAAR